MWAGKNRAAFLQKNHLGVDFFLFFMAQAVPPMLKFIGIFDFP